MKKLCLTIIGILVLVGCTPVKEAGDYKEGVYFGSVVEENTISTAVVTVDSNGKIVSTFIDATYNKDGIATTKKALGDDYGMKETSANIGKIVGGAEWDEQVEALENKVVLEQGLDWLTWLDSEQKTTDSVSGVTIEIDALYGALSKAINQAKK